MNKLFKKLKEQKNVFSKICIFSISLFLLLLVTLTVFRPITQNLLNTEPVSSTKTKKMLPIYSVETDEKKIALTFDAAWGADDTDQLIEILNTYNAKATFFVCGYWAEKYPEQTKKLYNAGHEIGNHSASHPHPNKLSLEQNKDDILQCHKIVKNLLGIDMNLYRPPYGEYNDTVLKSAKEAGYETIQWDVDSLDWKVNSVSEEVNQVLKNKNLRNGSILLFHNDAKHTPEALKEILKELSNQGYSFVNVSDLILKENYYLNHEGRQIPEE